MRWWAGKFAHLCSWGPGIGWKSDRYQACQRDVNKKKVHPYSAPAPISIFQWSCLLRIWVNKQTEERRRLRPNSLKNTFLPNTWKTLTCCACFKGPSHIQNGARPTSLRAKNGSFGRKTAGRRPVSARSLRGPPRFLGIGRRSQGTETIFFLFCGDFWGRRARKQVARRSVEHRSIFGRHSIDIRAAIRWL